MIRVMIADDQAVVREGIKKVLSLDHEINVICEVKDGYEAISKLAEYPIDVILMDVRMPKLDGIHAAKKIKEKYPYVKIIILTTFDEDEYLFDGFKSGISGYLLKDSEIEYIIKSVKEAYHNKMIFDPTVTPKIINALAHKEEPEPPDIDCLTEREQQISKMIAKGHSNLEIANTLFLTEGTVKNNVSNILKKLNLQRRTQIITYLLKKK